MPNESVDEAEGDPEGLPHLTKKLLTHIVQQVGSEGAHAIIKSLKWGDGAAKELLHLIVDDLKDDIKQGFGEDAAGVGVVAKNKKMAKDPRYSTSMTVDVKPGTPAKNMRALGLI